MGLCLKYFFLTQKNVVLLPKKDNSNVHLATNIYFCFGPKPANHPFMKYINSFIFLFILIMIFSIASIDTIQGQRKYDDKEYEPQSSLRDRIYVGVYVNSPYIGGSNIGSQFGVGLQPFIGFKFNEILSAGYTVKFDYTYFWQQNFSTSLSDFATTLFGRATLGEQFILQVEGGYYSHQTTTTSTEKIRFNFPVAYAGVGYSPGNYEILLSYEITGNLFQYRIPFEYKIGFLFNL